MEVTDIRKIKNYLLLSFAILIIQPFLISCDSGSSENNSGMEIKAGGDTSVDNRTSFAFEVPATNLSEENLELHLDGDIEFGNVFVTPPAPVNPGLGPLFNNVSCVSCHIKNGKGLPVFGDPNLRSLALVRVSDPNGTSLVPGGNPPVQGIGNQIQDHATFGFEPEANIEVEWEEIPGEYPDGTQYSLRKPILNITLTEGTPLPEEILTSFRMPLPVIGLGLLEAIPDQTLLMLADPDDQDGDGISGRPNMVWNQITESTEVGRFGRKSNNSNLRIQTARAYAEDMGVSNPEIPGGDLVPDITEDQLQLATFYVQTLAVPLRDDLVNQDVMEGENTFFDLGCNSCHVSVLETGDHPIAEVSNQTIQPFTDLLLHDMGEGLADNRPDFEATGREWRTTPLWGLGLTRIVSGIETFLHDGRARSIEEAILWHGGEAENIVETFRNLPKEDRDNLIRFLNTL